MMSQIRTETKGNDQYRYYDDGSYTVRTTDPNDYSWTETDYLSDGSIELIRTGDRYGNIVARDANNNLISERKMLPDYKYIETFFDDNGDVRSVETGDINGNYEVRNKYDVLLYKNEKYSNNHNKVTYYYYDGKIKSTNEFQGNDRLFTRYNEDGAVEYTNKNDEIYTDYYYDKNGNLLTTKVDNKIENSLTTTRYEGNREIETKIIDEKLLYEHDYLDHNLTKNIEYEYYPNGRMKSRIVKEDSYGLKGISSNIYDENGNPTFSCDYYKDGKLFYHSDENIEAVTYNEERKEYYFFKKNGPAAYVREDGSILYLKDGPTIDDVQCYTNIELKSDGTYVVEIYKQTVGQNKEIIDTYEGTYKKDEKGNFSFRDKNNVLYLYNSTGTLLKKEVNGIVYEYDYENQKEIKKNNGKNTYYKINHIEFDEETYNNIMVVLDNVANEYPSVINSKCNSCISTIDSFEDKFSSSKLTSINSSVISSLTTIGEVKESINYSLLAYSACDNSLEVNLHKLVDDLFDESEARLATLFKKDIQRFINDEDKDSILEYNFSTNFNYVNKVIPIYEKTDSDGNKWYLNYNHDVISFTGNPKINFGGEVFKVLMTEEGLIKLIDSKGNPLNIYGDYNCLTHQYGGDQTAFQYNYQKRMLLRDEAIIKIINKRFDKCTEEELYDYFTSVAEHGCGYTAMTNWVFKNFEGKEDDFNNTFGYPMYNLQLLDDDEFIVDYNYEPIIFDLYSEINGRDRTVITTSVNGNGTLNTEFYRMYKYLHNEYGVFGDDYNEAIKDSGMFGTDEFDIFDLDGNLIMPASESGPHAMTKIEDLGDGRWIVSTWGTKRICFRGPLVSFDMTDEEIQMVEEQYFSN